MNMIDQQKNFKNTEFQKNSTFFKFESNYFPPFPAIQEKSLIDLELAENGGK